MKTYYQILGIDKNASFDQIKEKYKNFVKNNMVNDKIEESYYILSDYTRRRKYDDLLEKKIKLSIYNIPFFGYDFDEHYVSNFKSPKIDNTKIISSMYYFNGTSNETEVNEVKKYKIDDDRYLIYEKIIKNGNVVKNYYIEKDGKKEMIPEDRINKIKEDYKKLQNK